MIKLTFKDYDKTVWNVEREWYSNYMSPFPHPFQWHICWICFWSALSLGFSVMGTTPLIPSIKVGSFFCLSLFLPPPPLPPLPLELSPSSPVLSSYSGKVGLFLSNLFIHDKLSLIINGGKYLNKYWKVALFSYTFNIQTTNIC